MANANENRDWRIYADFAQVLIRTARDLYANDPFAVELEQTVYALDSTTVDLCLSLFPWARFRKRKAAVKLHTLLDLRGNIPSFIKITDGKWHDVNVLDELVPEPGSYYVMDRGYLDFERLHAFSDCSAFFVIRAKKNLRHRRLYSASVDKATGVRSDQTIVLTGVNTTEHYPDKLRRILLQRRQGDLRIELRRIPVPFVSLHPVVSSSDNRVFSLHDCPNFGDHLSR